MKSKDKPTKRELKNNQRVRLHLKKNRLKMSLKRLNSKTHLLRKSKIIRKQMFKAQLLNSNLQLDFTSMIPNSMH